MGVFFATKYVFNGCVKKIHRRIDITGLEGMRQIQSRREVLSLITLFFLYVFENFEPYIPFWGKLIHYWMQLIQFCVFRFRYNLTQLMIGSEGTLGIITVVTLRLQKLPQHSVVSPYSSFDMNKCFFSIHWSLCSLCSYIG